MWSLCPCVQTTCVISSGRTECLANSGKWKGSSLSRCLTMPKVSLLYLPLVRRHPKRFSCRQLLTFPCLLSMYWCNWHSSHHWRHPLNIHQRAQLLYFLCSFCCCFEVANKRIRTSVSVRSWNVNAKHNLNKSKRKLISRQFCCIIKMRKYRFAWPSLDDWFEIKSLCGAWTSQSGASKAHHFRAKTLDASNRFYPFRERDARCRFQLIYDTKGCVRTFDTRIAEPYVRGHTDVLVVDWRVCIFCIAVVGAAAVRVMWISHIRFSFVSTLHAVRLCRAVLSAFLS